jgi:hypothetical protein
VRCLPDGTLEGATLSDHGYIIINMFFGAPDAPGEGAVAPGAVALMSDPTPGRMTTAGGEPIPLSRRHPAAANRPRSSSADEVKVNLWVNLWISGCGCAGVQFQDEREFDKQCADRAAAGYNSGMCVGSRAFPLVQ